MSGSSVNNVTPPPPSLPPKTRKLLGVETARAGSQESTGRSEQPAQTTSSNTTKRQHQLHQPATSGHQTLAESTLETRESSEASVSVVRIGPGVTRSVSSAGAARPLRTQRLTKPVRRSKSHLSPGAAGARLVTSITHGGSVTLVSLNSQEQERSATREFQPIEPDTSHR